MRGKWWRRALSLGLVLGLTAGLCACGDGGGSDNSALAKENVYKMQEFALPEIEGDDYNVFASTHRDGMIYLMMQIYHWSEENGNQTDIRVLSVKEDGSDAKMVPLEIPEWEHRVDPDSATGSGSGSDMGISPLARAAGETMPLTEEPETEEGTEGEAEGEEGTEGETEGEEGTEGETEGEGGTEGDTEGEGGTEGDIEGEGDTEGDSEFSVPDTYMPEDVWENSSYNTFTFGADGNIYAIRGYNYQNYNTGESIQEEYISSWKIDGSFQWESMLEGIHSEEEWSYINTMTVAQDGTATLILSGDNAYSMTVDAQGKVGEKKPLSEEVKKAFSNYDRIVTKDDGTFLVLYYDENDWTKEFIASYDPAGDTLGQSTALPGAFNNGGYGNMMSGINSDLICSNNEGIYTYKIGEENLVQKMSFINSDIYVSNFMCLVELDENTIFGVYSENYGDGPKAGIFTHVDPKDIPDKAVLVLAGSWVGSDMRKRVIDFNRSSEKYRIVVKTYDSYNTSEDWQAGYTQLNNDITSGNMPDILITDGLPVDNYVAKGLLADIGKLIEEDEELSQVEFVQNVFDAYSVDGKLYYLIPSFTVNTMAAKKSVVGDRNSWTMEDMMELQSSLPEETMIIGELTRGDFFNTMMQFCGRDFVDADTGKCEFDSQNFISMMEFAKTLPEELGEDYYGEDYWQNYESQYRDERTILCRMGIGSIRDTNYYVNGYFGGDFVYIGFPTESGMGSYVNANNCYAISSKSRNTEGAWEFLRYYLTEDYQSGDSFWGLPTRKGLFDKKVQEAQDRPYYMDENGEKQEYDEYFYMNGEEIMLDPLSKEQVDETVNFILSVDKCYYYNESILNIINEEMEAFFTGQKSAQEVAKIIQNRAQVYVDENR